jgi:amino acid adenylation domain-containing protein
MASANTLTIPRREQHGPRPLSFPQERLFLLDRIMPGLPAYNVPKLVRVPRTLDEELLRRAFERIVERHEILRTRIHLIDGSPAQEVAPLQPFELTVADLRGQPDADAAAQQLLAGLTRRSFDLGGDVLLRAGLVHVAADEDLLLVVFHHAGSDYASTGVLFSELDAIYTALALGRDPELPELPIQYADFAEWQREQLTGEQMEELVEYWSEKLTGAPERLDLPADRPRPSTQSYRGEILEFKIDQPLAAALHELARRAGVSLFMVLLAGFDTLLHRYTSVDDLVVGVPVSGRHHDEVQSLLGYFSNTLAVRCDLSGDPAFSELLARVKTTMLEAQIFQELPFEKVVEVLNPERAQSHSPIFQVLLGFENAPSKAPTLGGASLHVLPVPGWEWSRFDLSIVLGEEHDGSLRVDVEYATDLFDAATIARLVEHLRTLLQGAADNAGCRLSELPILREAERRKLLSEWNQTSRPYDRRCLHELFCAQASRTPDNVAVADARERITYGELERRSNQLSRELQRLGAGPGTLVGICLERSVDLVVALLGALKSGAAYVPIEPTYPPQRQEFMLADAQAPVLITQERFLGTIDPRGAHVVCIDRDRELIATQSAQALDVAGDPEHPAYVIYTSGSTGQPKGVEITHRSVANLIAYMRERPGIGPHDVLANLTTPAFDLSVPDWYLPLTSGARLVLVPREATLDGVDLADWLARTGATFVQATPTTWQLLVDAGWKGSPDLKIVCGGEALPRALAEDLLTRGAALWHMYGPTETTVWSSVLELRPGEGPLPLGGPIANTSFYVLDANRQPVPIGVPGELYIGGEGVAVGYHERPELTAEKFIDNPFEQDDSGAAQSGRAGSRAGASPAGRLYRTGDLLRWRENRTLEFHGRIDQQVKLRGFRIELGEIEAVLDAHHHVGSSVAIVREDAPGDQRLVAYVVPAAEQPPEHEELRRLLKTKLPPFMVPSAFVTLDSFPVTANGKLNRAALPAPDGARPDLARTYAPPQTPVEATLASVWREVLGVDRVGIDDDFFDLGGHSLLAVKMLARVQEALGLDLYLGRVFEHSTIRALAAVISAELLDREDCDELTALLAEVEASER